MTGTSAPKGDGYLGDPVGDEILRQGNRELAAELGIEPNETMNPWADRKRLLDREIEHWNAVMDAWADDPDIHFSWAVDKHQFTHGTVPWRIGPVG